MTRKLFSIFLLLACLLPAPRSWAEPKEKRSLCDIHYPSDRRINWQCRKLAKGDTPFSIFGAYWQDGLRLNRIDRRHFDEGTAIKVPTRLDEIRGFTPMPATYPGAEREEKFILIDQSEMFLGAYRYGKLIFSTPVAVGVKEHRLRNGSYRIDAMDRWHESNLYPVQGSERPYPMHYGLRFFVDKSEEVWPSYWIHGRDLPGYPASHGCIGLYDEEMQKDYYHEPQTPILRDAKFLYLWVLGSRPDPQQFHKVSDGPRVVITGRSPL